MTFQEVCVKLFDHFYSRIYRGSHFKLDLSIGRQQKVLENFNKLICNHLNMPQSYIPVNYLISLYAFAFCYFASLKTERRVSFNWIIGKKMFQRFKEKKDGSDYYTDKFLLEYNINLDDIRSALHEDGVIAEGLDPAEENEKLRFHGEARLFNCLVQTTLYNHRSVNCLACENKTMCKVLLKKKFPKTFKKRGYDK